jgi:3-phosphoinositide dependent protein kinase-1
LGDAKFSNEEEEVCPEDTMTEEQKMQADFAKMGGGRRGTMVGTINYVSPEMIKDQIAIPASDLWAFGCIIFKMHTGKVPFPGTVPQTVY